MTNEAPSADLLSVLNLDASPGGRFTARNAGSGPGGVVFGGQLLAQSLVAATRSSVGKEVLSMHTVFARAAQTDRPVELEVETMHDGRTFASLTVTATQDGRLCCRSLVLLHDPGPDVIRHADPAPPSDAPATEPGGNETHEWWERRIVDDVDLSDADAVGPPELQLWSRFPGAADDLVTSQAVVAYASDGFLIGTAMRPHAGVGQSMAHTSIATTVLAHSLAFHEPFRAGEWLLLDHRSSYAGRGRVHGVGRVFDTAGRLVASFSQEGMVREA